MSNLTHPSIHVVDVAPSEVTRIDIHEKMISPFADRATAVWVVAQLQALGWPAQYQPTDPRWRFAGYAEAARFHDIFDSLLKSAAPAYLWPVYIDEESDEVDGAPDWVATVVRVEIDANQF